MSNFAPVGERARWRVVYDLLTATETNGIVSYAEMAEALALDADKDRALICSTMGRAAREHEQLDHRAVQSVPNVGYRVVEPQEHLGLARRHQKRSRRSLVRAHSKAVNVDMSKIEPNARRALELVGLVISQQLDFNQRTEQKLKAHAETIAVLTQAVERTEAEREDIRKRLERLEAAL
jgi:hypothetical protein